MSQHSSNWISLSDMMTCLMLIFMLIAVTAIQQVKKQEAESKQLVNDFEQTRSEIFSDLKSTFGEYKDEWGIEVTSDLVVKFNNPDLLFDTDSPTIKPEYKSILDKFIPLYLSIINNPKYLDKIKEIRIEGHTADPTQLNPTYMDMVALSQLRANSVLSYIRESASYNTLSERDRDRLTFWFSANGLGNGRALDSSGHYRFLSGGDVSPISRRVEFRIVTNSDELINKISNQK